MKATMDVLEEKMGLMYKKLDYVQETFNETLMYTNKTYYMEELNIIKREKSILIERN